MTDLERAILHIKTRADAWAVKEVEKALSQEPTDENLHREREQAYMQGYEDASKRFRQEPCDDVISRDAVKYYIQAHIHEIITESGIDKNAHTNGVLRALLNGVDTMPSVTPQEPCDAISREAALIIAGTHTLTVDETVKAIKNLPSVTQKSGKWIEHPEIETSMPEDLMFYECSECGDKQCYVKADTYRRRFCGVCGSKMEREEKE